ncbi:hypothetical protein HDZ31DRAFT_46626 [Schizophyllum fasciatum]
MPSSPSLPSGKRHAPSDWDAPPYKKTANSPTRIGGTAEEDKGMNNASSGPSPQGQDQDSVLLHELASLRQELADTQVQHQRVQESLIHANNRLSNDRRRLIMENEDLKAAAASATEDRELPTGSHPYLEDEWSKEIASLRGELAKLQQDLASSRQRQDSGFKNTSPTKPSGSCTMPTPGETQWQRRAASLAKDLEQVKDARDKFSQQLEAKKGELMISIRRKIMALLRLLRVRAPQLSSPGTVAKAQEHIQILMAVLWNLFSERDAQNTMKDEAQLSDRFHLLQVQDRTPSSPIPLGYNDDDMQVSEGEGSTTHPNVFPQASVPCRSTLAIPYADIPCQKEGINSYESNERADDATDNTVAMGELNLGRGVRESQVQTDAEAQATSLLRMLENETGQKAAIEQVAALLRAEVMAKNDEVTRAGDRERALLLAIKDLEQGARGYEARWIEAKAQATSLLRTLEDEMAQKAAIEQAACSLQADVLVKSDEISGAKDHERDLLAAIRGLEESANESKACSTRAEAQAASLSQLLEDERCRKTAIEQEAASLRMQIESKSDEIARGKECKFGLKQEVQANSDGISGAKDHERDLLAAIRGLEESANKSEARSTRAEAQASSLSQLLEDERRRKTAIEQEAASLRMQIESKSNEIARAEERERVLKREVQVKSDEISRAKDHERDLLAAIRGLEESANESEARSTRAEAQASSLSQLLEDERRRKTAIEQEAASLRMQIESKSNEIARAEERERVLKREVQVKSDEISRAKDHERDLLAAIRGLEESANESEARSTRAEAQASSLSQLLEDERCRQAAIEQEAASLRLQIESKSDEIARAEERERDLKRELRDKRGGIARAEERARDLKQELQAKRDEGSKAGRRKGNVEVASLFFYDVLAADVVADQR